jgi:hypothetical protein
MTPASRKIGKVTVSVGILLASAGFFLAGLLNPYQTVGVAQVPGGTTGSPVTSIDLQSSVAPNPVTVGQMVTISGSLRIVGGPAEAKITLTVPAKGGGTYEGSFTTMLDENGLWGFTAPPFTVSTLPGSYTVTVKAEAGGFSDTESVTLTVNP